MKNFIDTSFTTVTQNGETVRVPDLGGHETDSNVHYSVMDRGDGTCLVRVTAPEATMASIEGATATTLVDDTQAGTGIRSLHPQAGHENLDVPDVEVDQELNQFSIGELLDEDEQNTVAIIQTAHREIPREEFRSLLGTHDASNPFELVLNTSALERADIVSQYGLSIPAHVDTATAARAVVTTPTVGRQVLQDQELTALGKAAKAKGLNRASEITKNTRADNVGELGATSRAQLEGKNAEHQAMLDYVKGNTTVPPWDGDVNPPAKGRL